MKTLVAFAALTLLAIVAATPVCDNDACEETCVKKLQWGGGLCKGPSCQCWKTINGYDAMMMPASRIPEPKPSCEERSCLSGCFRVKWVDGFCKDGECMCKNWERGFGGFGPVYNSLKNIQAIQAA